MLILLIYAICSASGLSLLKLGVNSGFSLKLHAGMIQFEINWVLILGAIIYVISFLLSLFAMSKMNLSYFYPISAGLIYVVVCVLSIFLFKEKINTQQLIGMGFILIGFIVMNIQHN